MCLGERIGAEPAFVERAAGVIAKGVIAKGVRLAKRDSVHHHLLEAISETATVLELRRKLLYATPSGWL